MQERQVWSLSWEDSLEKEMVTHSSILAWEIPLTEEPYRLYSSWGCRVGHDWVTSLLSLSVQFSRSVVSDSLRPHEPQHSRLPCPSPSPGVSFNISPSVNTQGFFRIDWLDLLTVQGTLKSLLQHHSSKASILQHSAFFMVQLSHPYMITRKSIALTRWAFAGE